MEFNESLICSLIAFRIKLSYHCTKLNCAKMNISELSNLNANVSVCVTLNDLKEFVQQMIVEAAAKPVEAEEKYLTTDEVCEILHVSSNTLWRWGKSGYLIPHKVGRTPQYKLTDVENLRQGKGA